MLLMGRGPAGPAPGLTYLGFEGRGIGFGC